MNCIDKDRYNNIPVMPLQQIGTPFYTYWSPTSIGQFQAAPTPDTQYQTVPTQQPLGTPITPATQVFPQFPQQAQTPMQDLSNEILFPPIMSTGYTQGYLRSQIGSRVKVEFLIGTNMLIDREGTLVDVGISYIIINETETDDLLLCDIYSIKFVKFYR